MTRAARQPSTTPGGVVSRAQVAFAASVFLLAPYAGFDSFTVDPRIAEVWPLGGVGFVLLASLWAAGPRALAAAYVAMVAVTGLTALAYDYSPGTALWTAMWGAAQPLLMMVAYRRLRGGEGWAPTRPLEVLWLLLCTVGSAAVVGLVGAYPELPVTSLPSAVLLWWVLRTTVFTFSVAVIFGVLFHTRARDDVLEPSPWFNQALLVPVAALCVVGTYHDPALPLSWLLLVPAVWAGMTLTLRGTAWLLLLVALMAAGLTYLPQNQFGYTGWLPAASIVDLLITAATAFALLLALMRQQRARLIAELDERGREAEAQRELLSTVVDTMTEGVLLVGDDGVEARNVAARQLLGRPLPVGTDVSWADILAVADADGTPLSEAELQSRLQREGSKGIELRLAGGAQPRVLEVVAKPLERGGGTRRRGRVLLLRDVTAERDRLAVLTGFVGHVAHDLRGPLTVLDGWLETAVDEESDPHEADYALHRAFEASHRMRQVIEDWLAYTLVQQGRIRPERVALHEVAESVVESRVPAGDDGLRPQLTIDLPHHVRADPALLRQLLDNLVDNAIKYTGHGRAPTVLLRSGEDAEPGWVHVEVVDEGMGVPEGEEEAIFEEFRTGPTAGRSEGTGLGLALTRRIVGLHGGAISARRNQDGPGSTFRFTLPRG